MATLSDLRKAQDMTQMDLAAKIGTHVRNVARWEAGNSCPSLAKAVDLARVLRVSLDELAEACVVNPALVIADVLAGVED